MDRHFAVYLVSFASASTRQGLEEKRYQYNSMGEPIRIETDAHARTLYYNALGQIAAVEEGSNAASGQNKLLAQYAYNGARQRVAKTVDQGNQQRTTYFTWHHGLVDAELDSRGRVERRVIYLNLRPVALLEYGYTPDDEASRPQSTQRFAIHGDHLGTPQVITDDKQRVVWLARYDAFGRATAQGLPRSEVTAQNQSGKASGRGWIGAAHAAGGPDRPDKPFEFNLRFAGQYEDAETGWHYNWHRYYEPDTGRYLTPDPIGLRGGANAYGYVGGDPFGAVDPWGLARLVVGIEVPRDEAILPGRVLDLFTDTGHTFAYLVNDNDAIVNSVSFGPVGGVNPYSTEVFGVPGTANYPIAHESSLFSFEIDDRQLSAINSRMNDFRANTPSYSLLTNTTCTSGALNVAEGGVIDSLRGLGVDLPSGVSPVQVPLPYLGNTVFNLVNPLGLYDQLIEAGHEEVRIDPVTSRLVDPTTFIIQNGARDPALP